MRFLIAATALGLVPLDAFACGGFFCGPQQPVYQAGEEIVFGIDSEVCEVSAHISIVYNGAAEDFAWIVPVAGQPELFPSSSAIFSAIRRQTDPFYNLQREENGVCDVTVGAQDFAVAESGDAFGWDDGVNVVDEGQVGPYDTVVLQALDSGVLLTWLQNEGYELPSNLEPVLQPYVADNQYFVALKLASGQDTGNLSPLGMRYDGCAANIPIQLTSIAANPDMPIDVYVFGDSRAVPDNYLHVELNEAAIDWYNLGSNVVDVIGNAADEAGGQAFSTMFADSTDALGVGDFDDMDLTADDLAIAPDAYAFMSLLAAKRIPFASTELIAILEDQVPFPQELADSGVAQASFYQCMDCFWVEPDLSQFDAAVAAARIEAEVFPGLTEAEALFSSYAHFTRLTTTMNPEEMTADPVFVLNSDLPQQVSNTHNARDIVNCGVLEGNRGAERILELDDGRRIKLPSRRWLDERGLSKERQE